MKNKKFAICYNKSIEHSMEVKDNLKAILDLRKIDYQVIDIDNMKKGFDFVFVIGGDGTILKAARFYSKGKTIIFGINLGRLGFLSQSSTEDIEKSIDKILNNDFEIQERIMLQSGNFLALNDIVIKGTKTGRTSRFALKINDEFICNYLADGIIISTPTGSTAYGLSAGGPILAPNLNVFVIIPICPHTLTARPLVIPISEKITICACSPDAKYVASCDGQSFYQFKNEINIEKSQYVAKLALLNDSGFYTILRDKLHWSVSPACNIDKIN